MAIKYTGEQLNSVDKSLLVQMFLNQQEQLESLSQEVHSLNEKMQLMMEQLILSKKERFGRSTEKWKISARSVSWKWTEISYSSMKRKPAAILMCQNLGTLMPFPERNRPRPGEKGSGHVWLQGKCHFPLHDRGRTNCAVW